MSSDKDQPTRRAVDGSDEAVSAPEAPEDRHRGADAARRALLKVAIYVAPTVIGTLAISNDAQAQAPSCMPQSCTPYAGCMPQPCTPDDCMPFTCGPFTSRAGSRPGGRAGN